ncbi:MAG: MotE family protein [Maritimibacter sp.]
MKKKNPDKAAVRDPSKETRKKRKSSRRNGRGLLWLIAASLLFSGVLRIGANAGSAIAQGLGETSEEVAEQPTETTDRVEVEEVMALLKLREERVATRENQLADKEQALEVARAKIEENLVALRQAEKDLERMIALSATAAEDDLARLTTVYENMKPKQAAALFSQMAPEFAAGFLGRMRADSAAAIMAGLEPQQAYTISVMLAGRNTQAPTE